MEYETFQDLLALKILLFFFFRFLLVEEASSCFNKCCSYISSLHARHLRNDFSSSHSSVEIFSDIYSKWDTQRERERICCQFTANVWSLPICTLPHTNSLPFFESVICDWLSSPILMLCLSLVRRGTAPTESHQECGVVFYCGFFFLTVKYWSQKKALFLRFKIMIADMISAHLYAVDCCKSKVEFTSHPLILKSVLAKLVF